MIEKIVLKLANIFEKVMGDNLAMMMFRIAILLFVIGFAVIITMKERCYKDTLTMKYDTIILLLLEIIMIGAPILIHYYLL